MSELDDVEAVSEEEVRTIDSLNQIGEDDLTTIGQGSYGTVSIYKRNPEIVIKEHAQGADDTTVTINAYKELIAKETQKSEHERDLERITELQAMIDAESSVSDACQIFKEQEYDKQEYAFSCFNSFLKSINSKIPRPITFKYATRTGRSITLTAQGDPSTKSCVFFMEKLHYPSETVLTTIIKPEFLESFKKTNEASAPPPYLFFSDVDDEYQHGRIKLIQMKTAAFKHGDKDLFASITDENVINLATSMMSSFFGLTFNCGLVLQDIEFLLTNKLSTKSKPCIGIVDYDQVQYFKNRQEMGTHLMKEKYSLSDDIAFIYMNLSGNSMGHPMQIDNKSVWKFLPDPNILPEIFLNQAMFMLKQTVSYGQNTRRIIPDESIEIYSKLLKIILNVQYSSKLEKCKQLFIQYQTDQFENIKSLLLNRWHNNINLYMFNNEFEHENINFEKMLTRSGIRFEKITELDLQNYSFFIKQPIPIIFDNDNYTYYLLYLDSDTPVGFNLFDDILSAWIKKEAVYNFFDTSPELILFLFDILIQKLYLLIYFSKNNTRITEDLIAELTSNIEDISFERLINYFEPSVASAQALGGKKINKTKKNKNKKNKQTKRKMNKRTKTKKSKTKKSRKSRK